MTEQAWHGPDYSEPKTLGSDEINTANEFALGMRGKEISTPWGTPTFRTKQAAYRFAAWLTTMAKLLPNEIPAHSYEEIRDAIRNT